ncbi:MAG: chromosome segregation SMC family protein [Nanoarchaeota archaeon]
MSYIKKLVIYGFKSFAAKTELPFDKGINVIIGPNGSGKSNISDALCFVLGRLSIKSMRAAKASNLLFQGSHERKPAHEAFVEIVFDNSDNTFNIDSREISIKRLVRKNGLSIYKINDETKTRQEIIELLAQAGIDPNGYNIVLQGEIARLIKMRPDERREIIEEVAGISIYETRKQKSLSEIEKTEQKLKEVGSVLRERTAYLRNLEQERKQALKFKELEQLIKQCKASILKKNIEEKLKEINEIEKNIDKDKKYKDSIKKQIEQVNSEITSLDSRINEINQYIHKTTGFERETLNEEITDLNVKIASESARKENFEKRLSENKVRKSELEKNLKDLELELESLRKKSPMQSKKQDELKKKKAELEKIVEEREKLLSVQTELSSIKHRVKDKEKLFEKIETESKIIFNQIKSLSEGLSSDNIEECNEEISKIKSHIDEYEKQIIAISSKKLEIEKSLSIYENDKRKNLNLKEKMPKSDICPICHTKLTHNHVSEVISAAEERIKKSSDKISELQNKIIEFNQKTSSLDSSIKSLKLKLSEKQQEFIKLSNIEEKKSYLKKSLLDKENVRKEITDLENHSKNIEKKVQEKEMVEDKYQRLLFEIQEVSSRTEENLDTTLLYKERETESIKNVVKNIIRDQIEIDNEIKSISQELKDNQKKLNEKEKSSKELSEKFNKLFEERSSIQEKIKNKNIILINHQNGLNRVDDVINNLKVSIAGISASKESFEFELKEFPNIEFLPGSKQTIEERLEKSEKLISEIGNVNLRALETYDAIKEEYDKIAEKATQLENERDQILKIIEEIDIKKKKVFMKTFTAINDLFTRNFSQLSVKGRAFLELENEENIFEGGVNITIKVGKGKYFDVTSLSGGEQTLVALSLIFAIQEYKPFFFYILDEIDAALDKRNSELLSNLLKKYIQAGQYIIISHNDSIISGADVLYGVSMNSGVSKVLRLAVREKQIKES